MLKYTPAVFAVGNTYQIMAPVNGHQCVCGSQCVLSLYAVKLI